jgi:tRNA 2-thiouridine synthesizing protein A
MSDSDFEEFVDASGLLCPLPVLKARKRLLQMKSGDILKIVATDPMSAIDMPHFCSEQGHTLLSADQTSDTFTYRIQCK